MSEYVGITQDDLIRLILAVKMLDKNDDANRVLLEKLYDIAELEEVDDSEG